MRILRVLIGHMRRIEGQSLYTDLIDRQIVAEQREVGLCATLTAQIGEKLNQFRATCQRAWSDGKLTPQEQSELDTLQTELTATTTATTHRLKTLSS
jgi:hypothetical protein